MSLSSSFQWLPILLGRKAKLLTLTKKRPNTLHTLSPVPIISSHVLSLSLQPHGLLGYSLNSTSPPVLGLSIVNPSAWEILPSGSTWLIHSPLSNIYSNITSRVGSSLTTLFKSAVSCSTLTPTSLPFPAFPKAAVPQKWLCLLPFSPLFFSVAFLVL